VCSISPPATHSFTHSLCVVPLLGSSNRTLYTTLHYTASEMSSESLCYQFQLNHFSLNITESTINALNRFIIKSGFLNLQLNTVSEVLFHLSKDGLLTKSHFDKGMKYLLTDDISEVDKVGCLMILSSIFYTFDRTDSDAVDVTDLVCGLAVICNGSKSSKLAFTFDLMDEDGDNILTKRGLWRYFRSFLCVLLTVSGAALDMSTDEIVGVCDDCAVWTSAQLLSSLEPSVRNGCTFENLADWYTSGGYQVATWLELLDLSKWLPLYPLEDEDQYQQRDDDDDYDDDDDSSTSTSSSDDYQHGASNSMPENPYVENDGTEIFRAALSGGSYLTIMESDSNFIIEVAQLTGLYKMTPQAIVQKLHTFCHIDAVTIRGYNNFVSMIVPNTLDEEELARVSYALSSIYFSYDDDGENRASFASLAAGLCVLCHGSKSTKLSACFHLFDSDGDGYLTPQEIEEFLGSFLRILLACSFSTASQRQYGQTSALVNATCELIAEDICQGSEVDFQRFGDWYNDGGYKVIPWIELIDLSKWVKITAASALTNSKTQSISSSEDDEDSEEESDDESYEYAESDSDDDDDDDDDDAYRGVSYVDGKGNTLYPNYEREHKVQQQQRHHYQQQAEQPTFTLMLYRRNAKHIVSISADTVHTVSQVSCQSGLSNIEPESIFQAILATCSADSLLSRKQYDRFIARIHPDRRKQYFADVQAQANRGEPPSSPFSEKNADIFGALFDVFDRTGKGVVDASEIAIGLGVLCSGSKSSKLAAAFDLLDEAERGTLSRRSVWKYFRSFICALLTLSGAALEISQDEAIRIADSTALFACDSVLTSVAQANDGSQIANASATFDDIADWYGSAGYSIAPWLELLDMSKWEHLISDS
jgi:Ca2+-binding EF-hand superfamily protein